MKIPIPFLGWIEEDEIDKLKERDCNKDEPKRSDCATNKNNPQVSNEWRSNEFSSLERKSSKSPENVEAPKP